MLDGTATDVGALDTIRLEYTTIFAYVLRWTAWLAWGSDSLAVDSYRRRYGYTSKGKWLVGEAVVHRVRPRLPCFEQRSAVGESCQSECRSNEKPFPRLAEESVYSPRVNDVGSPAVWIVVGFFPSFNVH